MVASVSLASAPSRPVLVVFDFDSEWDGGRLGRKAAEMFRGHAERRRLFVQPAPMDFVEMIQETGLRIAANTPPRKVSEAAARVFGADVAIWGKVERLGPDHYILHVKILDRRKDPTRPVLDRTYTSTLHGIQMSVDAALDEFLGRKRPAKQAEAADWRKRRNLCSNGDFERGDISPDGWEKVDGLATFWVEDPLRPGKCIMIDTDVLDTQYREWRRRFEAGAPASEAPPKLPTKPPKYDTIGGIAGAHLYSDPIPIKPGRAYRIDLDVMGRSGKTKCFVKGYAPFISGGKVEYREVYRAQLNLKTKTGGRRWEHFSMVFHPTQPFILLPIRSGFDAGATGRRLRTMLAQGLRNRAGVVVEPDDIDNRIKGREDFIRYDASKHDVAYIVAERFGRGVAVWGDVTKEDDSLVIRLRSIDVRPGGTATKDWWRKWKCAEVNLERTSSEMVAALLENARVVTYLRVKLDAYWPPGKYYFDNVWVTEEPENGNPELKDEN